MGLIMASLFTTKLCSEPRIFSSIFFFLMKKANNVSQLNLPVCNFCPILFFFFSDYPNSRQKNSCLLAVKAVAFEFIYAQARLWYFEF